MPVNSADEQMHEAIIVVDDEPFSQDCVVEALRGSFPHTIVDGVASVDDLYQRTDLVVALVLLKAERFLTWEAIATALKTLDRYTPKAAVVLISTQDEIDVVKAIAAGLQGVLPVTASLKVGVAALRLVLAGGTYYPRPGLNAFTSAIGNGHSQPLRPLNADAISRAPIIAREGYLPARESPLQDTHPVLRANGSHVTFTSREADVLALLQKGHSNKWIADHLKLSENTVKVHIQHIMRKLHATNRTEAVVLSVSHAEIHSS